MGKNLTEKKSHAGSIIAIVFFAALYVVLYLLDNVFPVNSMPSNSVSDFWIATDDESVEFL